MTAWEELEQWITAQGLANGDFNVYHLARSLGIPTWAAGRMIQAYLIHQTGVRSRSLYVLTRTGRTRSAVWHVGSRVADAQRVGLQAHDDFETRLNRFLEPTLTRIGQVNPRALPQAEVIKVALQYNANQLLQLVTTAQPVSVP